MVSISSKDTHDSRVHHVAGEFKAHGFPQQLTLAINQLLRYRHKAGRVNDELMVAAPYISPEGAQLCRDDNVSYFDLAGSTFRSILHTRRWSPTRYRHEPHLSPRNGFPNRSGFSGVAIR